MAAAFISTERTVDLDLVDPIDYDRVHRIHIRF